MARTATKGESGWSLVQLAREAGVTRGLARAAVARGYLPTSGLEEIHILLLRVAAACMDFPDPTETPTKSASAKPGRRDTSAQRFARAAVADPATTWNTCMLLAGMEVEIADNSSDLITALERMGSQSTLILPLGKWIKTLPSQRAQTHGSLRLIPSPNPPAVDDPFGDNTI